MLRPLFVLLAIFFSSGVSASASVVAHPNVVENGSDVVLYNYPGRGVAPLAFTPDGSAFAEYGNGILKIAPDGTETLLPADDRIVARLAQTIVYSNGYLWYEVYHGIVRIKPDGSQHRFFQFSQDRQGFHYPADLTAGADGLYFNYVTQGSFQASVYHIARIDVRGVLTVFSLPATSGFIADLPMVWAKGHLYFEYATTSPTSRGSLGRLESDGTIPILPGSSHCFGSSTLVFARNAFYFIGEAYDASLKSLGQALCRATLRGNFATLTPPTQTFSYGFLDVDAQDELWTPDLFGNGLYSYDIATAKVSGPYEPSKISDPGPFLNIGPDQNVWTFTPGPFHASFITVYVRHVLMFEPTKVDLSAFAPSANFVTVESLLRGPWTAKSLDPAIATVTPAMSQSGRFTVSETGAGTTSIAVTDLYGNVLYEPVTAH
jgi:hypothetical protein